ncbi:hypothetical protein D9619_012846 [Psilocybe cf. subviscida]|uniref:Uncharacterized protein n=1 Tax=Psilocybe cf. subviscida TaxID=2480587 RepID=A0A8H5ER14_9AGAR|nr:hypothetical protein D9619_012846 [Psilocybe cf. subviscida]
MPPRNVNNNTNTKSKKSKRSAPSVSPPADLSPPAQLPTPLPDPPLTSPGHPHAHEPSPTLIDLDAGTPPPETYHASFGASQSRASAGFDGYQDDNYEEDGYGYEPRSPPFREVVLPLPEDGGSPPPLPVPPRRGSVRRERDDVRSRFIHSLLHRV